MVEVLMGGVEAVFLVRRVADGLSHISLERTGQDWTRTDQTNYLKF